jgi:hypothetical protein
MMVVLIGLALGGLLYWWAHGGSDGRPPRPLTLYALEPNVLSLRRPSRLTWASRVSSLARCSSFGGQSHAGTRGTRRPHVVWPWLSPASSPADLAPILGALIVLGLRARQLPPARARPDWSSWPRASRPSRGIYGFRYLPSATAQWRRLSCRPIRARIVPTLARLVG